MSISLNTLKLTNDAIKVILDELETTFPEQYVHPKMSTEEIMYNAGQASVIRYVKSKLDEE
jgi:hypothetical protein